MQGFLGKVMWASEVLIMLVYHTLVVHVLHHWLPPRIGRNAFATCGMPVTAILERPTSSVFHHVF